MKFKNYVNSVTKNNKIYSSEDLYHMPVGEAYRRKKELLAQNRIIGIPTTGELKNSANAIWVESYTRSDGTHVNGYWRSKPEGRNGDFTDSSTSVIMDESRGEERGTPDYNPTIELPAENKNKSGAGSDDNLEDVNPIGALLDLVLGVLQVFMPESEVVKILKIFSPLIEMVLSQVSGVIEDGDLSEINPFDDEENKPVEPQEPNNTIEEKVEEGVPTGQASKVEDREINNILNDQIKNVENILTGNKNNLTKEIENASLSPDIYFEKPEQKSLLYQPLIDINEEKNEMRPDAKELMNISLIGANNLPKSIEYKVLPYGSGDEQINNKFGIDKSNDKYVPKDYFGVEFAEHSSLSKNLSKSQELQEQVLQQYDSATGKFKNDKIEISLTEVDKNLQYSIGHFTIFKPKMQEDGTFTGEGFDMYNYNYLKPDGSEATDLNNKAYYLQCAGIIKNYYIKVPIKFKYKRK